MRKFLMVLGIVFAAIGAAASIGGYMLEREYQKFRKSMTETTFIQSQSLPRHLSTDEKHWSEEGEALRLLADGEKIFFDTLSQKHLRDPFKTKIDYISLKKQIHEIGSKVPGASWRSHAVRGQLFVRELVFGLLAKSDEKELKQLWQQAAASYKEARLRCNDVQYSYESSECIDTVTKSYEFLITPTEQGGLGGQESARNVGDKEADPTDIPLIRGRGAGSGSGSFGQR